MVMVSTYDTASKESFYHGFMLGMVALLVPTYSVKSNRESGYGRFDLAMFPQDKTKNGVIMEFKTASSEADLTDFLIIRLRRQAGPSDATADPVQALLETPADALLVIEEDARFTHRLGGREGHDR